MVHEDHFRSPRALTERMKNLYGVRTLAVRRFTTCGQGLPRTQDPEEAPDCQSSPAPPRLGTEAAENLTVAAWSLFIWGDESRFQLYPIDGHMRVRQQPGERFQQDCQAVRIKWSWSRALVP